MEKVKFGATDLRVSRLCFGTGYLSVSVKGGARLLRRAYELGVNFWDTSDDYGTYPHVAAALRGLKREEVVIAAKTYAKTALGAKRALTQALHELKVDWVDIMLLHAVDSLAEFKAKQGALEGLVWAREEGLVRATGISTHSVRVLKRAAQRPEVEVLLVPLNRTGYYMVDCRPETMLRVIQEAYSMGKALYAMKVLHSGTLPKEEVPAALQFALGFPYVHALCISMQNPRELEANVATFSTAARRPLKRKGERSWQP